MLTSYKTGDAAKQLFEKARLPNEVLGQIWNLADREQRGALNPTEFVVAMHLLASMRNGSMRSIPQTLPPGLYEAAARRGAKATGPPPVSRQFTAQAPGGAQSPLSRSSFGTPPLTAQTSGGDWLITPQDKAKFDQSFTDLDKSGQSFVTGDQAVSFFSNSGLSEDTLASIWDLADINSEGQLNRDEFAVAMYLIRQQRAKKDGRGDLPAILPPRLMPPSMRQRNLPPSQPTAPAFDNATFQTPQPKSAADDLFGLDALSASSPVQQTTTTKTDPFANESAASPTSSSSRGQPPQPPARNQANNFKPFIPTSSFGQGLAQQSTGGSFQSDQSQPRGFTKPPVAHDDLLGDNDPEVSNRFTQETTDVSNMSNQANILNSQLQDAQSKKVTTERDLTASTSQKRDLEAKLAQSRTQYEQELRNFKSLEERLTSSRNETKKLGQELAMVEGTHQDLQTQHQQVVTALEADQRENTTLKEKIRLLNTEISELKPKLEKLRSDARQQKGLTAINKKQLSTNEGEQEKLREEQNDLEKSIRETAQGPTSTRSEPGTGAARTSTDSPSSAYSPPVTSPGGSAASQSRNPFFRQATQQSIDRTLSSSTISQENRSKEGPSAFDTVFGPSVTPQPESTSPTSFGKPEPSGGPRQMSSQSTSSEPPATVSAVAPDTAEAPPVPPEYRQMASSALPLRTNMLRSDSLNSSVMANAPASRSGFSEKATPAQSTTSSVNGDVQAARETEDSTPTLQDAPSAELSRLHPRRQGTVPGAFPGEAESPVRSTPTGGSVASESSRCIPDSKPLGSDFLPPREPSALSGINQQRAAPGNLMNGSAGSKIEFPPIQDVQKDESDSDSDEGFDDNFTTTHPNQPGLAEQSTDSRIERSTTASNTRQPEGTSVPQSLRNAVTTGGTSSGLPTPTEQKSPPTYDQSESSTKRSGSNQFPREYADLLPSREPVASSPEAVASPPVLSSASASHMPFGSAFEDSQHHPISTELKDVAHHKGPPTDDFDSAFDDLSEAKEADDPGQDDFSFSPNHKNEQEFNPAFDSAPDVRAEESQRTLSGRHTFTNFNPSPDVSNNNQFSSSQSSRPPEVTSHDWDEIFSGLDSAPAIGKTGSNKDPFAFDQPSRPSQGYGSLSQPKRPDNLARAISTGTEHDDPILKTLTNMGYPRDQALNALEKYDYNLDKVRFNLKC